MNIGIFSDTYYPQLNGVGTSIHTLQKALEAKGHNVYIFTPYDPKQNDGDNPHIIRLKSVPNLLIKGFRTCVAQPPSVLRKIDGLHLDLIHTQTEFSVGMLGKFVAVSRGIPMIHTYHTMYENYVHYIAGGHLITPKMAGDISAAFCNAASHVVVPTEKTRQLLLRYGVTKPIHTIPTGIDTENFRKGRFSPEEIADLRHTLGIEAETPVVVYVGRLAKEKNLDMVFRAMPTLLQQLPDMKFLIVGWGPEREHLEELSAQLGIDASVIFTGGVPWEEIGKYYQLGDVFCSASVSETQGLTFAEAMAAGVPVVAKKDPCIENIVTDGKTGLLFEQESDLPKLLYYILTEKTFAAELSQNGLSAMEELSVENFGNRLERLYTSILQSPEQPIPVAAPKVALAWSIKFISLPEKALGRRIIKHVHKKEPIEKK